MNLKILRKNSGLTQKQVADKCGISLRAYQNYEANLREMNYQTLKCVADCFHCSIDYLIEHQSNDIIYSDFTQDQQKAISMIKKLDEKETAMLLGYLARMTNTPLETLTESKKDQEENYGG